MSNIHPVPAESVRVWRGFKLPNLALPDFLNKLSAVFVPATVQMQNRVGLTAYIPTITAGLANKPDSVPDETAVLFWNTKETYSEAFKTLATRTYTLTHASVYNAGSGASFPVYFEGALIQDQPYFLFNKPADWMTDTVTHLTGSRPANVTPADFLTKVSAAISGIQKECEVKGAIVCVGADYLVYWELGTNNIGGISQLKTLLDWQVLVNANSTSLDKTLWEEWPGMDINPGDSFNMQFKRY